MINLDVEESIELNALADASYVSYVLTLLSINMRESHSQRGF